MKRIISFLTVLSLLVASVAMAAMPAAAEVSNNYDDNLVSWYNFEGADAEGDQAQKGTAEPLTFNENATAENGYAIVFDDPGSCITIPNSGDFSNMNGKTLYLSYRLADKADDGTTVNVFTALRTFRYWLKANSSDTLYSHDGGAGNKATTANVGRFKFPNAATAQTSGEWVHVAVTFEIGNETTTVKTYISMDGTNYTVDVNTVSTTDAAVSVKPSSAIILGKSATGKTNSKGDALTSGGTNVEYDEIRLYDTVLPETAIASLASTTPYSTDTVSILGNQEKANGSNIDVRFLAHLNVTEAELDTYSAVGFEISATYEGVAKSTKTVTTSTVYNSIKAGDDTITVATFEKTGGYIIALPITNVPTTGTVVFTVRPFCTVDGGFTYYGETVTATYTNGAPVV